MTVRVLFDGGPLHGQFGHVENLPQCQIFFDERQRLVYCYNRCDELCYVYEAAVSKALSDQYDKAYEKFGKTGQSVAAWGRVKPRLTGG